MLRFIFFQAALLLIILGAFFIGAFYLPIKALFYGWPKIEETRLVISKACNLYLFILKKLGLITVSYKGLDELKPRQGVILVANHPSLLDIIFLLSLFPTSSCMAKKDLLYFSPYSLIIRWASYVAADAGSEIVEQANIELQNGRPFIIFPEGTRKSQASQKEGSAEIKFRRGAAAIALKSNADVIPIIFNYNPPVLGKNRKWYDSPKKICEVQIEFFPAISFSKNNSPEWEQRRDITKKLEDLFTLAFHKKNIL